MAKLGNARTRIDYTATLRSGQDLVLDNDDSFVGMWVAVPLSRCEVGETLSLTVKRKPVFVYPAADLVDRYGRFMDTAAHPPGSLRIVAECVHALAQSIREAQNRGATAADVSRPIESLSLLLKSFAESASIYMTWYGIKLEHAFLVPPSGVLRAEFSKTSKCDVYVRGLRASEVA
jgi:hypothetical protein